MKQTGEVVLGQDGQPLMALHEYGIEPELFDFDAAYQELVNHIHTQTDASHTWGYFPELNPDPQDYPESVRLAEQLRTHLFDQQPQLQQLDYTLAFIRAATAEPVSDYGGLHVDVHVGIAHQRDARVDPQAEIIRFLLNPYSHSRTLRYIAMTADELREEGFDVPTNHYRILELPESLPFKEVEIPPLTDGRICGLQFYSSLIPHAGITDQRGHYLIVYGAYKDPGVAIEL